MSKIVFVAIFLCITHSSWAQTPTEEKIAAWPSKKNLLLIDTLMTVSGFENYFVFYCEKKIEIDASINKWDSTEIQRRKSKISFADFKDFTIYNSFAVMSTKDLHQFITFCRNSENPKTIPSWILDNYPQIRNNLPLFVTRYLE